jgi:hypothetical protein
MQSLYTKASFTSVGIDGEVPDMSLANALLGTVDGDGTHIISLKIPRDDHACWYMSNCGGDHPTDINYQKLEEQVQSQWLLNPTLDCIEF